MRYADVACILAMLRYCEQGIGCYQHCSEKHLHRYLAEFDFRYNNRIALGVDDKSRAETLAAGIVGKRLTYRRPDQA